MIVLMTGVEWDKPGMIGTALSKYLVSKSIEVVPFEGDIRDRQNWVNHYNIHYDFVIHLAAKPGVRDSQRFPMYYEDVNINGTKECFKFCENQNIPVLYASSSNAEEWWVNPYATTKKTTEHMADMISVPSIGMRFHTVWPGRDDMLFKMIENGKIEYVNLNHSRDYIHIDDLCNAIFTILNNFELLYTKHNVVDIGSGESVKTIDVFKKYWDSNKYTNDVFFRKSNPEGERICTRANVEYLKKLGWKPKRKIV